MDPYPRRFAWIHPAAVEKLAIVYKWKLDRRGRVPANSTWKCQICGKLAHVGLCVNEKKNAQA